MTESNDPFEILRDLNPVRAGELGNPGGSPEAQAALEEILRAKQQPRLVHALRRRPIHLLVLALLTCAVVAATAWALTQGGAQRRTVGCYQTDSLSASTFVAPIEGSPLSTCHNVWRKGELGPHQPAHLEACILPSGDIGVFPSAQRDVCVHLHLAADTRDLSAANASNRRPMLLVGTQFIPVSSWRRRIVRGQ